MNEQQTKFLEAAKYYEQLKEKLEETKQQLDAAMVSLGVGTYLQDPETLAVYRITTPTGTFIKFRTIDYVRTSLPGEVKGSLSKKEAEEQGFSLKK